MHAIFDAMVRVKMRRHAPHTGAFAVLLIALLLTCLQSSYAQVGQDPSVLGGPFRLVDQTGATVTDQTYHGKWLVMFFGFTHCPDVCPMTLGKITEMMELLGKDAERVQPLFITVDPERDTVGAMRDYVAAFDRRVVGLTGPVDAIATLAKSYNVVSKGSGKEIAYTIGHSAGIYLVDPEGRYITTLDPPCRRKTWPLG
jgi:protein SCO1/2